MKHTLRGGNKEADRLANEAMDRGMGKAGSGGSGVGGVSKSASERVSGSASRQISKSASAAALPNLPGSGEGARQVLEGYVKGGVVHLLEGELPDGIFVKIIRES
jgi:probable phosphoglycerate mutase